MSSERKLIDMRNLVKESVSQMKESEKKEILDWAQRSLTVVQDNNLTKKEKLRELQKIKSSKAVLNPLFAVGRFIKSKGWENRSWAVRFAIGGATVGMMTFGSKAAGLAAMGTAVGIPLALITATGAMMLGVIIDELKKIVK